MYEKGRRTVSFAQFFCFFPDFNSSWPVKPSKLVDESKGSVEAFQGVRLNGDWDIHFLPLS
jgi:hypothetical protein